MGERDKKTERGGLRKKGEKKRRVPFSSEAFQQSREDSLERKTAKSLGRERVFSGEGKEKKHSELP